VANSVLKELLRELAAATRAQRLMVAPPGHAAPEEARVAFPLGSGATLFLWSEHAGDGTEIAAAVERSVRAVRSVLKNEGMPAVAVEYPERPNTERDRVLDRIRTFLTALTGIQGMTNVVLMKSGDVISSASPVDDATLSRIAFATRRADAEASRASNTSHSEVADEDVYVRSFWYSAYLVSFFDAPYPLDFVRYQTRMVARELAPLLEMLLTPPPAPAGTAPLPE